MPKRIAGLFFLGLLASIAMVLALAPLAANRVVAVGDIHGDLDAFAGILQRASLLDSNRHWSGKDATLVQTGDMIDRGPQSRQVMELLMQLQKEAPRQNGRVIVLLGNHEAMNIYGDLRYVTTGDYASYADDKSEIRRKPAGDSVPLGFVEQREAFGPDGRYGKWLRTLPAVVKVNDTLFLHGGLRPDFASWKIEQINDGISAELKLFDAARKYLVDEKIAQPFSTLRELADAAKAALTKDATKNAPNRKKLTEAINGFARWMSVNSEGPLWFRGYARWTDEEGPARIEPLLSSFGVKRIVVGHTPQSGRIVSRFNDQLYLIDTGMLSSYFPGGRASALEIQGSTVTPIY